MWVCPQCGSVYAPDPARTASARCTLDNAELVESSSDPLVGRRLDRYQIEGRLAVGGMGCVYQARHAVLDRSYAIKVLFGDFAHDERFQARFRREATAVSRIDHPNIVKVEDFGRTPAGLTFLAMELVVGQTLEELLAEVGPLSPARAAQIVRQAADGLGAAHDLGFVHRDVKPANVMLARSPRDDDIVKILDFGTVSLRALPSDERLTAVGHLIGTPMYMAPEQVQNPNVGPTADVYALGVMLYEMLVGRPPFTARRRAEVIVQHLTADPPSPPPKQGLERLVARMLRKRPEERPASMAEVIAELDTLGFDLARARASRLPTPSMLAVPASGEDPAFHAAPTSPVLFEAQQAELQKLYLALSARSSVDALDATPREDAKPSPREDTKPTPREDLVPAMAAAVTPSTSPLETQLVRVHRPAPIDPQADTQADVVPRFDVDALLMRPRIADDDRAAVAIPQPVDDADRGPLIDLRLTNPPLGDPAEPEPPSTDDTRPPSHPRPGDLFAEPPPRPPVAVRPDPRPAARPSPFAPWVYGLVITAGVLAAVVALVVIFAAGGR